MLNIPQIIELYKEGLDLHIKRSHPLNLKGEFDPSQMEIFIYSYNLESDYDRNITILHEFIHARDDIIYGKLRIEDNVEKEAIDTYNRFPLLLELIGEIWAIPQTSHPKDFQNLD